MSTASSACASVVASRVDNWSRIQHTSSAGVSVDFASARARAGVRAGAGVGGDGARGSLLCASAMTSSRICAAPSPPPSAVISSEEDCSKRMEKVAESLLRMDRRCFQLMIACFWRTSQKRPIRCSDAY